MSELTWLWCQAFRLLFAGNYKPAMAAVQSLMAGLQAFHGWTSSLSWLDLKPFMAAFQAFMAFSKTLSLQAFGGFGVGTNIQCCFILAYPGFVSQWYQQGCNDFVYSNLGGFPPRLAENWRCFLINLFFKKGTEKKHTIWEWKRRN